MSGAAHRPAPSRRQLLLGGVLVGAAAVTWARMPRTPVVTLVGQDLEAVVPEAVGDWRMEGTDGIVLPPEPARRQDATYDHVLTRRYLEGEDAPVMVLIAYDRVQSGMLQVHRPEACYPAAGFRLADDRDLRFELAPGVEVEGRFLTAVNGTRSEQILYWTRIGDDFPVSYDAQRRAVAGQNLRGLVPDGTLVRLSTLDEDGARARTRLLGFARRLYSAMSSEGRATLAGPVNAASRA